MWQSQTIVHLRTATASDALTALAAAGTIAIALFAGAEFLRIYLDSRRRRTASNLLVRSNATILRSELRIAHKPPLRYHEADFEDRALPLLGALQGMEARFADMLTATPGASRLTARRTREAYSTFSRALSYLKRAVAALPSKLLDEAFVVATEDNLERCLRVLHMLGDPPEWDVPSTLSVRERLRNWWRSKRTANKRDA